jgi:hypothetical protein
MLCYSAQLRKDILEGKKMLPTNIQELKQVSLNESWDDSKFEFMRRSLFPTNEEHDKDISGFYSRDPYVPI